jgi:hypothetical protein
MIVQVDTTEETPKGYDLLLELYILVMTIKWQFKT